MTTINLTQDNFDRTLSESPMVIVDFWAPWCAPCRFFAPTFEAASAKFPGAVFAKVNTEEEQELADMFNIRSIPTLMIVRDKIVLYSEAGTLGPDDLDDIIAKAQALDMDEVQREIEEQKNIPSRSCRLRQRSATDVRVTWLRVAHARARAMGIASVVPLRTDVDETNLDAFIEEHAVAVLLIHSPGQPDQIELEALAGICAEASLPTALAAVDAEKAAGILAQFGIVQPPYLLVLRERVALYAERVLPSAEGLRELLRQVQSLDMDKVREDIEVERRARESLETRRACPTLRSGPARTRGASS